MIGDGESNSNRRDFSLQQLRCFLVVADELHFGRAAQRLQMTQPPLTRQIVALESNLNVTLFNRTSRHVELTAAGRALLEYAATVVRTAGVLRRAVLAAERGGTEFITVGFIPSLPTSFLAKLVEFFTDMVPNTELVLQEMHTQNQLVALDDGTTDIAIVRLPVVHDGLIVHRLILDHLVVIMPSDREVPGDGVELSALAHEDFITYSKDLGLGIPSVFNSACAQAGFAPRVVKEVLSTATLVSYVARGYGIALVPSTIGLNSTASINVVKISGLDVSSQIAVAWRRDAARPAYDNLLRAARLATEILWGSGGTIEL